MAIQLQHNTTGVHNIKVCPKCNVNAQNNIKKYLKTTIDFSLIFVTPTKMVIAEPL